MELCTIWEGNRARNWISKKSGMFVNIKLLWMKLSLVSLFQYYLVPELCWNRGLPTTELQLLNPL